MYTSFLTKTNTAKVLAASLTLASTLLISFTASASENSPERKWFKEKTHVTMVTGVVWEGATLREFDVSALMTLRDKFPSQRMTHFINPAYLLRKEELPSAAATISKAMRPGDGIGLHLSGWKSLVTQAGAVFRSGPTFWGSTVYEADCQIDCGREVPLSVYSIEDFRKIAAVGSATLEMHGFGSPSAVQINGWVANLSMLEQLASVGLKMDFSSIAPASAKDQIGRYPVYEWINDSWSGQDNGETPRVVSTAYGEVTTHPTNGGLVDFHSVTEIVGAFERLIKSPTASNDRYFYLGIQQETAGRFAQRFAAALESIREIAASNNVEIINFAPSSGKIPSAAINLSH